MKRQSMAIRRVLVVGAALALAAPLAAQQIQPGQDDQQFRYKLQTFEGVLQSAVRHGGETFAREQAPSIPPGIQLFSDDPQARGFAPPQGGGLIFLVVVPALRSPVVGLFLSPRPRNADPLRNVGGGPNAVGGNSAMTTPSADPMAVSPVVDDGRCATRTARSAGTPIWDYEYAVAVCDALMEAMLDNSGPLPVKEEEWLTVAAIDGVGTAPGVVNSPYNYTTYLAIKGSDLLALRQDKISKDEARKRVRFNQR